MRIEAQVLYPEIKVRDCGFYCWMDPDEQSLLSLGSVRQYQSPVIKYHYGTKLHTTIMYHERALPINPQFPLDNKRSAVVDAYELWDVPGGPILVARLNSPELEALHFQLRAVGFVHSYDDYVPHVTLGDFKSLSREAYDHVALLNRKLPPFKLQFGPQIYGDSIA